MSEKITAGEIEKLMRSAIKEFGRYTWDDKGPREVMDLDSICSRLRALGPAGAADVLKSLRAKGHKGSKGSSDFEYCFSAIMVHLQDWDEFMNGPVEEDEDLQDF